MAMLWLGLWGSQLVTAASQTSCTVCFAPVSDWKSRQVCGAKYLLSQSWSMCLRLLVPAHLRLSTEVQDCCASKLRAGRDGLSWFQWVKESPKSIFFDQRQWSPTSCSGTADFSAQSFGAEAPASVVLTLSCSHHRCSGSHQWSAAVVLQVCLHSHRVSCVFLHRLQIVRVLSVTRVSIYLTGYLECCQRPTMQTNKESAVASSAQIFRILIFAAKPFSSFTFLLFLLVSFWLDLMQQTRITAPEGHK